jgi:hypothetical protein
MEVIVALAILGLGVVTLIQLFSVSLRTVKKSGDYSTALIYARSLMDEAYSYPGVENLEGNFDLGGGFTGERTMALIPSEEEEKVQRYEIRVTVMWPPSGKLVITGVKAIHEKAP